MLNEKLKIQLEERDKSIINLQRNINNFETRLGEQRSFDIPENEASVNTVKRQTPFMRLFETLQRQSLMMLMSWRPLMEQGHCHLQGTGQCHHLQGQDHQFLETGQNLQWEGQDHQPLLMPLSLLFKPH